MKKILALFLLSAAFFTAPSLQAAEEPRISVKAEVNKAFITIGDPVIYTITVKHHKDVKLVSAIHPPSDQIFKVKNVQDSVKKEGDFTYEIKKATLTVFSLGEYILDPVSIQYLDTDGQPKTIQTDKIYISVRSVAQGKEITDIRGVKAVIKIPKKFLLFIYIVLGAAAVLALVLLWLRRKKPQADAEPKLVRSLEDEALFRLNQLFDSDLLRRSKIKEYYLQLSDILKFYLERRFKISAGEATTFEIQRMLREKEIDTSLRTLVTEVLEAADLAKFAKWKPEPPEIVQINQKSKQIIETARPKEVRGGI